MQPFKTTHFCGTRAAPIAQAAFIACLAIAGVAALPTQKAFAQTSQSQAYQIPSGSLDQVLNRFAASSGITLAINGELTQGKTSEGLHGQYSVEQGLQEILRNTDLQAVPNASGSYSLRQVTQIQSATSSTSLPEVSVSAAAISGAPTEDSGSYTTDAIRVFKGTQSIRRTPQPVTVVTNAVLKEQALGDVQQVLIHAAPGVTINYSDSERVAYYARGYEIDGFQINGMPSYRGGSAMLQTDTITLDRIEVLRGAAGLLRGSGNPSATVNMVRKMPTSTFQGNASVSVGSWNKRRADLDISGPLNEAGTLRGRLIAAAENKHFFQDVRHDNRRVLYGVVQADISPRDVVTAGLEYATQNATGAWGNLPAAPDGSQLNLPRSTYLGAAWNEWNREKKEVFFEYEHFFDNEWELKAAVSHNRSDLNNFRQSYFTQSTTNPYAGTMEASIYKGAGVYQTSGSVNANGPFELLGRKHELMLGIESQRVRDNGFGYGWWGMSKVEIPDIRQWNPYTDIPFPSPEGEPTYYGHTFTRQHGAYAATRLSVTDDLTAILGARLSWWSYQAPSTPANDYSINREVTPYYGLVYDVSPNWSAYASYSKIFTPQRAFNTAGKILDPIEGQAYEAGLKGELMDGRLNATFAVFRINNVGKAVDDTSSADPCLPNYTTGYCKISGGKTRSQGFEVELQGQLTPQWNILGGYTNTHTRYVRDSTASNVGQPLRTLDPRQLLRLYSSYQLSGKLSGLTLGGGVQIQSEKYATARGVTYRQGGLALYNAMASYQINPKMSVQLNVNNIFDKVYYAQIGSGINNYYGEPRSWQLTLRAHF